MLLNIYCQSVVLFTLIIFILLYLLKDNKNLHKWAMELNLNKTFNLYSSMDLLFFALFCSFVPIARLAVVIGIIYYSEVWHR